ncbi:MAG TPA: helix-hairpin-helix domain-containing protein [Ruminococcus sp.]
MMPKGNKKFYNYIFIAVIILCIVVFSVILLAMSKKINNTNQASVTVMIRDPSTSASLESSSDVTTIFESVKTTKSTTVKITEPVSTEQPLFININTASKEELMSLNGIGSVLADRIISYRNNNNGFKNIDEIMNVSGIGNSVFAKIQNNIFVENPVYEATEVTSEIISETQTDTSTTEHIKTLEECAPININTASKEELMLLPHIDEENAMIIIDIRERINGYTHVYEILLIDTITQEQAAEIVPYICVE